MNDLESEDLYEILKVNVESSEEEIKKAYRKQALKFHPDKNPDPDARITFERISKAYDILGDQSKRSQYDIKFKARLERLRAEAAMSSERKRMRDDLLKKEKEAKKQKMEDYRLQEELRRKRNELREENLQRKTQKAGAEEFQELPEYLDESERDPARQVSELDRTLKFRWKQKDKQLSKESLESILCQYGKLEQIVFSSKGNSALVVFESMITAYSVITKRSLNEDLMEFSKIEWASGSEPESLETVLRSHARKSYSDRRKHTNDTSNGSKRVDFETATLLRMQHASSKISRDLKRKQMLEKVKKQSE